MPEWPDLHVLRNRLEAVLTGKSVTDLQVHNPVVLRAARPPETMLLGRTVQSVTHRGKFLAFHWTGGGLMVVNPMLTGLFSLVEPRVKRTRDTALTLGFGPDLQLRYRDEKQMGKVYLLEDQEGLSTVPGFLTMGPDADPERLDEGELIAKGKSRRFEVRNLLLDQEFLAGIGNAYADEILFEARLHPKRKLTSLDEEEWANLARAVRAVLGEGVQAVEAQMPPTLGVKVRSHMRVRGREGTPCPRCGTRILLRSLGYLETNFCPTCQLAPPGQIY